MTTFSDAVTLPNAALSVGRWQSRTTTAAIANTLTQVVGGTMPANTMAVGTQFRWQAMGIMSNTTGASTTVMTLKVNAASLGSTNTASWSVVLGTTTRTDCPFIVDATMLVLTTGASGSAWGVICVSVNTTTALVTPTTVVNAAVTIDTTANRVVELACISGASTTTWTFTSASIEIVKA